MDEEASTFYVLEIGNCDVFVAGPGSEAEPVKVHAYTSGRCGSLHTLHPAQPLSLTLIYRASWGLITSKTTIKGLSQRTACFDPCLEI